MVRINIFYDYENKDFCEYSYKYIKLDVWKDIITNWLIFILESTQENFPISQFSITSNKIKSNIQNTENLFLKLILNSVLILKPFCI